MSDIQQKEFTVSCPIPISDYPQVLLAHGSGGKLMQQLIDKMFTNTFSHASITECHDAAVVTFGADKLAFTTDSFVVHPIIFPGGDIGKLAVHGTVNDLAMAGAKPLYLSLSFILEEGLPMDTLWQIVRSIKEAADESNVQIITGDTKVVDRGKGDGIYINTAGIGVVDKAINISSKAVKQGDAVIVSGDLGRHGMAIMAVRESLEFESNIESDTACLSGLVQALLRNHIDVHCLRDLTRGGLSSALNEIAQSANCGIEIDEAKVPVREDVAAACEMLGLDPLYVANEGRFVAFIKEEDSQIALEVLHAQELGRDARIIGAVINENPRLVQLKSKIGARRILDMLSGEQLPRIC